MKSLNFLIRPGFDNNGKRYFLLRGSCLKEDEAKIKFQKIINIYIVYDLQSNLNYNPDFTLENCLFGAVKITKNTDVDQDLMEEEFLHIQLVVLVIMNS